MADSLTLDRDDADDRAEATIIPNMHPEDCLLNVSIGLRLLSRDLYALMDDGPTAALRIEEMWWITERIKGCYAEGMRQYAASRRKPR